MLRSVFTRCSCCSNKAYICPVLRRAFSLPLSPFLWLELKSMFTQLRNVDLSSKVHSEEGIKQIPDKKFNNSNTNVESWLQYYQNQARRLCVRWFIFVQQQFPVLANAINDHSTVWQLRIDSHWGSSVNRSKVIGPFKQFKDRNTCL